MTWRHFTNDSAEASADPVPASVREQQDDAQYAGDFATLVAVFRTQIEHLNRHQKPEVQFAGMLTHLRTLIVDGWGSPDAGFPQQCFTDHGPAILLRALAKAYEQPVHVVGELEGD